MSKPNAQIDSSYNIFHSLCYAAPPTPPLPIPHQRKMLRRHRALQEACAQDPLAEVAELPPIPPESERELASSLPPSLLALLSCDFSIVCTGMLSCTCTIVALLHSLTYTYRHTYMHTHTHTAPSFPQFQSPPLLASSMKQKQGNVFGHTTNRPGDL